METRGLSGLVYHNNGRGIIEGFIGVDKITWVTNAEIIIPSNHSACQHFSPLIITDWMSREGRMIFLRIPRNFNCFSWLFTQRTEPQKSFIAVTIFYSCSKNVTAPLTSRRKLLYINTGKRITNLII